jgi:hypothetical protein
MEKDGMKNDKPFEMSNMLHSSLHFYILLLEEEVIKGKRS